MRRTVFKYNVEDLDDDKAIGILLPITRADNHFNQSYTTEEQAISNLKNLLLTSKGERIMLPDFGTNLTQFLFENINQDLLDRIETEIISSIEKWLPNINIIDVRVYTKDFDDPYKSRMELHTLFFEIDFSVKPYNNQQTVVLFVSEARSGVIEEPNV